MAEKGLLWSVEETGCIISFIWSEDVIQMQIGTKLHGTKQSSYMSYMNGYMIAGIPTQWHTMKPKSAVLYLSFGTTGKPQTVVRSAYHFANQRTQM